MLAELILRGLREIRRYNRESVRPEGLRFLWQPNCVRRADAPCTRVNRNAPPDLVDDDGEHKFLFALGKGIGLPRCAEHENTVNAGIYEPVYMPAQLRLVNALVFIHRCDNRTDYAFDFHFDFPFALVYIF